VQLATARRAWHRWQAAAGPWQGWSICPALLSPELENLARHAPPPHGPANRLAEAISPLLEPGGALCLLDLDPLLGVQTAARLTALAHPVLVLPRWPYARAVLPTARLTSTLVAESHHLPAPGDRRPNVVIVLDADRARPMPNRRPDDPRADNRHTLTTFELPDLRALRSRGITRIHRCQRA
jgi:hypothetical protein